MRKAKHPLYGISPQNVLAQYNYKKTSDKPQLRGHSTAKMARTLQKTYEGYER